MRQPYGVHAEGEQAAIQEAVEDDAQGGEDGGADDEANYVDQDVLSQLQTQALGARVVEGPAAIEDEVGSDGGQEGEDAGGNRRQAQEGEEQVEDEEVDGHADSADDGKFKEALLLAT